MDPITLTTVATQVVAILTSLFSKVGESIATKFGEDAYEESKHLYEVVRDRFAKKDDDGGRANKALQNFADDPQLYGNVFKEMLLPLLHDDPEFARELSQIIQSGPTQILTVRRDSSATDTDIATTDSRSSQKILVEDNSQIKGTTMTIGSGEVQKHRSRNRKKK